MHIRKVGHSLYWRQQEMVRRPSNWNTLTDEAKTRWLQNQSIPCNGGRKAILKENDKERVWSLLKKYENKSLVAELL